MNVKDIKRRIADLPTGNIVYKKIKGRDQPYLQWYENGKTKSKYIKKEEREVIIALVEERKRLSEQLQELQNSGYDHSAYERSFFAEPPYRCRVVAGRELERLVSSVDGLEKRDCYRELSSYVHGKSKGKVCLLYGLRRTGKTTLLFQAARDLDSKKQGITAYIKARTRDTMSDLNYDLRILAEQGYKYIFIDEVTLIEDFIDSAALLSDVFAMQGIKIVLSGTDSLGFWLTLTNELYDRAYVIHTTYIPFHEYNRVLGIKDVDEYIRFGGTLKMGEAAFDDEDAMADDAPFRDDETTRRYIDTAICSNIQHSLACCERGNYFRHLRELYEEGELTGAINRIIESMNHKFLLSTLIEKFKSHDLGSAAEVLRKQADETKRTDILDRIDREGITEKLMKMLEIKDVENQKVGIRETHVVEIKEYLKALDLVMDCPSETLTGKTDASEYVLFLQPGMRYSQAQALVYLLTKDDEFLTFDIRERNLACEKILEEVRGRMMEDIVLLETAKARSRHQKVFKLILSRSEIDMVIYNEMTHSCKLFEIKHSNRVVSRQYQILKDKKQCDEISKKYGEIETKTVIYRGATKEEKAGIKYINVEEYLCNLK